MLKFKKYINRLPLTLVQRLKDCKQDPKWHPEGSVYNHTKLVFEYADKFFNGNNELLVAAIFHDLGKLETTEIKIKEGVEKITHYGHEFKSLKFVDYYFHLFKDLTINKETVYSIVLNHMRAHLYTSGKLKNSQKRKDFEKLTYFDDIIKFSECDGIGRG